MELLRRLESLQNLEAGVWRHFGDWSPQSLRSLESLREFGVWNHSGVWSLESGVTPESGVSSHSGDWNL